MSEINLHTLVVPARSFAADCRRCGAKQCIGYAFGCELCARCWSDWCAEPELKTENVNNALGLPNDPALYEKRNGELFAAESRRRTFAWCEKGMPK